MKKISLRLKISFSILIPLVIMLVFANVVNIVYVRTASKGFVYQILNQSAAMEVESLKSIINDEADITVGFANTVAGFYKDGVSNRNFYEAQSAKKSLFYREHQLSVAVYRSIVMDTDFHRMGRKDFYPPKIRSSRVFFVHCFCISKLIWNLN